MTKVFYYSNNTIASSSLEELKEQLKGDTLLVLRITNMFLDRDHVKSVLDKLSSLKESKITPKIFVSYGTFFYSSFDEIKYAVRLDENHSIGQQSVVALSNLLRGIFDLFDVYQLRLDFGFQNNEEMVSIIENITRKRLKLNIVLVNAPCLETHPLLKEQTERLHLACKNITSINRLDLKPVFNNRNIDLIKIIVSNVNSIHRVRLLAGREFMPLCFIDIDVLRNDLSILPKCKNLHSVSIIVTELNPKTSSAISNPASSIISNTEFAEISNTMFDAIFNTIKECPQLRKVLFEQKPLFSTVFSSTGQPETHMEEPAIHLPDEIVDHLVQHENAPFITYVEGVRNKKLDEFIQSNRRYVIKANSGMVELLRSLNGKIKCNKTDLKIDPLLLQLELLPFIAPKGSVIRDILEQQMEQHELVKSCHEKLLTRNEAESVQRTLTTYSKRGQQAGTLFFSSLAKPKNPVQPSPSASSIHIEEIDENDKENISTVNKPVLD